MSAESRRLPAATRIGRVRLRVPDRQALRPFYRGVIGLELLDRGNAAPVDQYGAGSRPLLEIESEPDLPPRAPTETGLYHIAALVPTRRALGAALDRIRAEHNLDGAADHLVSEALYCTDPADNGIEIYADRPRDAWPRDPDGTPKIDTKPLDLEALAERSDGASMLPAETRLGHVHLEVSDVAASERFYVETLGMAVQDRFGSAASFVAAGDYHHHIGLNSWNGRTDPPHGAGLDWFEVVIPQAGMAPLENRLAEAGVATERLDGELMVTDPDGIRIRVRATTARADHASG